MWDLPRPGLEPMSPALAGRFSTTVPPGKPLYINFYSGFIHDHRNLGGKYLSIGEKINKHTNNSINKIILKNKKEQVTDIPNDRDGSRCIMLHGRSQSNKTALMT